MDTTERFHFPFSLSCIGEGDGNPLQCSCLENPRDGRAWWAAVYGVAQGQTRLYWLSSSSSSSSAFWHIIIWIETMLGGYQQKIPVLNARKPRLRESNLNVPFTQLALLFSLSVMSCSLWPCGLQHARLPCPLLSPWFCSNSCPLSKWCHPIISSSVAPFFCPRSFAASGSSYEVVKVGASVSSSALPMNIQGWFPLGLTGLISLQFKELFKSLL